MIVKDEESIVVGTVKVKNISFEKEVVVRVTWDDWKNQQDIFCTFARVSLMQLQYKEFFHLSVCLLGVWSSYLCACRLRYVLIQDHIAAILKAP